jgi:hypothetical protein
LEKKILRLFGQIFFAWQKVNMALFHKLIKIKNKTKGRRQKSELGASQRNQKQKSNL